MNGYRNVTANFTASPPVLGYAFITLAGSTNAGSQNGSGGAAQFNFETGVASDKAGNVYVADTYNSTIRKISPDGVVTTIAGSAGRPGSASGVGSVARFLWPNGVAVDGGGTVYVADTYNSTIRKITPEGNVSTLAGAAGIAGFSDGLGAAAKFNQPSGVAVDGNGVLYVADLGNNSIRRITSGGVVGTLAGWTNAGYADGLGTNALLNGPAGVGVDGMGNVFVADTGNNTVRRIGSNGLVSTLAGLAGRAGRADGAGTNAQFNGPAALAADAAGNLYVVDTYSYTIRRIASDGTVTTIAGAPGRYGYRDGAGTNALFDFASGIAVDGTGNLYVADTDNNVIRKGWWSGTLPVIALRSPKVNGGQVQLDFTLRTGPGNEFRLLSASQPAGPWSADATAMLTTNVLGVSYSFRTWSGAPVQFYRTQSP
jgi:sugar lactone lactonase YvrE